MTFIVKVAVKLMLHFVTILLNNIKIP